MKKLQFGMPTLIENHSLEENIALCQRLGLNFIELNMNFPEYQLDKLEEADGEVFETGGVSLKTHMHPTAVIGPASMPTPIAGG